MEHHHGEQNKEEERGQRAADEAVLPQQPQCHAHRRGQGGRHRAVFAAQQPIAVHDVIDQPSPFPDPAQSGRDPRRLLGREPHLVPVADVVRQFPQGQDIARQAGLQLGRAGEHHHRVDFVRTDPGHRLEELQVLVVLAQRVLEPGAEGEDLLGPGPVPLAAEDPAAEVFRLEDKDPVHRHHHVVDLGGVVVSGEQQVVDHLVAALVEPAPQQATDPPFTGEPLEKRRVLEAEHQDDGRGKNQDEGGEGHGNREKWVRSHPMRRHRRAPARPGAEGQRSRVVPHRWERSEPADQGVSSSRLTAGSVPPAGILPVTATDGAYCLMKDR